jgi:hypothetical protein
VILCTFTDDRCTVCGAPRINARQVCGSWTPGLGDYVHAGLAAVGVTPARVAAALGVDDCGCEERREWANQAGYALGIGSPPSPPPGEPPDGVK